MGEYEISEYFKDNDNRPFGLILAVPNAAVFSLNGKENIITPTVTIGISVCHKSDNFNRVSAYQITKLYATTLMNIDNQLITYKYPLFRNDVDLRLKTQNFLIRCYHYYKDRLVILPKIEWLY